jgi:hypothetical protein
MARTRGKQKVPNPPPTYENEVLGVLVYEFFPSEHAESERLIKGRLRRKKLGPYDQARIDRLRRLKDELQVEIHKGPKSAYFTGSHDPKYVDMRDFDSARLARDMIRKHPGVPAAEIEGLVPFCVFNYYLR